MSDSKRIHVAKKQVLRRLKALGANLYHVSKYDSIYIRFRNKRLRSLRIADHNGREKYKYKWNLVLHGETRTEVDMGISRNYYNIDDIDLLIEELERQESRLTSYNIFEPWDDQ
jgi:hypothetical protein